jgi:hypothetical protein
MHRFINIEVVVRVENGLDLLRVVWLMEELRRHPLIDEVYMNPCERRSDGEHAFFILRFATCTCFLDRIFMALLRSHGFNIVKFTDYSHRPHFELTLEPFHEIVW